MERENVLGQGIDGLFEMKKSLVEFDSYRQRSTELGVKEDQLEKQIATKEKAIADEVLVTIKKRRQEVENSFNEQIEKLKSRMKKVKAKRDKEKNLQVSERIKNETSDLTAEKIRLKEELKSIYQKNQISRFYNNRLFHALLLPRNIKDIGIILLVLVITLLLIPVGVYKLFLPAGTLPLILDYIVTVVIFFGLYLFFNSKLKEGHAEAVIDIRAIRAKQAKNQKKINAMAKDIRKDKDESTYSLADFTEELNQLEEEVKSVTDEKKNAMVTFETETRLVIEEEVRARYREELNGLKSDHETAYKEQKNAEEKAKQFSIEIASKYESYVGKEMLTVDKIDRLIAIMQEQNVQSISEALAIYKNESTTQTM